MKFKQNNMKYKIEYQFNHPRSGEGFANSITVEAHDEVTALRMAKDEVYRQYSRGGLANPKLFSFKQPIEVKA